MVLIAEKLFNSRDKLLSFLKYIYQKGNSLVSSLPGLLVFTNLNE